ncbi:MAG: GWxTD domain-containing protein [Bacteroidota bacterium]
MRVAAGWIGVWLGLCLLAPEAVAQRNVSIADELVAEGEVLLAEGDRTAARRKFEEAIQYDRRNGPAYRKLGALKVHERNWKGAIRALNSALGQDPDDLDARYHRAIANRELGRLRTALSGLAELIQLDETGVETRKHYRRAEQDFKEVISQDSAYRDVLYQYAQLEQYRNRHTEAIALGHEQVRVRPEMPSAQTGLLRLYRMFTEDERSNAEAWLAEQDSPYARLAEADLLRRSGDSRAAEAKLIALQQQPPGSLGTFPLIAVHTALARIYSSLSNARIAESQFWSGASKITSASDAALLMADLQYILSPEELHDYAARNTPEQWQAFFREAWTKRNPLPAASGNARIQEHYQRLVEAEKNFAYYGPRDGWNDPAMAGKLEFGETYRINNNYNDKGLIYIRHGAPNDRVATIDQNLPENESWLYRANGNSPRLIFHFMNSGGSNWRLVPVLLYSEMLEDRVHWGAPYAHYRRPPTPLPSTPEAQRNPELAAQIASAHAVPSSAEQSRLWQQLEWEDGLASEMQEVAQADVDAGLSSDRYQWTSEVEPLPMAFTTAAFRGTDGQALLEVFYALNLAPLERNLPGADESTLDLSLVLHNPAWQPVARQRDRKRVPLTRQPGDGVIDGVRVIVPPDSYQVAVHVEPEGTSLLGGFTEKRRIPDFSGPNLMLSDMLVAFQIGAANNSSISDRSDANILPNPSYTFTTAQNVYAYFEAYNLTFAADDQTDYLVEYTLLPQQKRRGLFRRKQPRPAVTLSVPQRTTDRATIEYTEIDVSNAEPGPYVLRASVTDRVTGQTATTERPLLLTEPAER